MIFLDTGFVFALVCPRDASHARAKAVMDEYQHLDLTTFLLTTNHVVEETVTLLRVRGHRDAGMAHDLAVRVGRRLFAGELARVHQVTPAEERAGFAYLAARRDQKYSLTDCISFVIMESFEIREALSVDDDFTHSFVARPGPPPKR